MIIIKNKKSILIFLIIILIIVLIFVNLILNFVIFTNYYKIDNSKIPSEFKGYVIVQLSDIHSIRNEKQLNYLIEKVEKEQPDMIVITGDLVDSGYYQDTLNKLESTGSELTHEALTISFMEKIVNLAPTYYIYGNHEMILLDDVENNKFKNAILDLGVNIINNEKVTIEKNGSSINLLGIQDPATLYKDETFDNCNNSRERIIKELDIVTEGLEEDKFSILLSHRPEYIDLYSKYKIDLILSGHAHGGQVRLPFIGGLYAPNQGWFPKYTKGLYKKENSQMIVSSGLGNSIAPIRIFDPFEIVVIVL